MSDLQKQIDELKEEQQAFIEVCQMPCADCKLNIIMEVLRKLGYDYVKHMKEEHTYIIPLNIEKSLAKLEGAK